MHVQVSPQEGNECQITMTYPQKLEYQIIKLCLTISTSKKKAKQCINSKHACKQNVSISNVGKGNTTTNFHYGILVEALAYINIIALLLTQHDGS